jgi:hypothetical protein
MFSPELMAEQRDLNAPARIRGPEVTRITLWVSMTAYRATHLARKTESKTLCGERIETDLVVLEHNKGICQECRAQATHMRARIVR